MNSLSLAQPWPTTSEAVAPAPPRAPALQVLRANLQAAAPATADAGPLWEPTAPSANPTTSTVLHATRPPEALPAEVEAAFMIALTRSLAPGETHTTGNAARERELAGLIIGLSPLQTHHLGRRLDIDRADDAFARAWKRLLAERRDRLRALMRDPRRAAARR